VITHKSPVYSADNVAVAVSTVITDVSARVRAEETLRESEQRSKDFAQSASDWLWETDTNGTKLSALSAVFFP
jgi:PAS domain-containing protein